MTRELLHKYMIAFYWRWIRDSEDENNARHLLIAESEKFQTAETLLTSEADLCSALKVRTVAICDYLISRIRKGDYSEEQAGKILAKVCTHAEMIFVYLRDNVLNIAERHFR